MQGNKVAGLITNYNMPERADALAEVLLDADWPLDLYLVDNGSDLVPPAKHTTVKLDRNVQTTGGWLAGLEEADKHGPYLAYMFLITSADFPPGAPNPVKPMATWLLEHEDAVGIHPALTEDSTTSWEHMKARGHEPRRTWMIDNICSMFRADWFNSIGRFDPAMTWGWGIDLETCYQARRQARSLWIDERCRIRKITDIGYSMNRMNMTSDQRRQAASNSMHSLLYQRYGSDYWKKMTEENVTDDMR